MITTVTFDLWDTIVYNDTDEPKRAAQGLRTKKAERRHLVWQAVNRIAPIEPARVDLASDLADAAFNKVWHDQHVTWTIAERLQVLLAGLKRELPAADFTKLVEAHEVMEVEIYPDAIEGIGAALAELSQRYKLCIVSDTIVTPGTGLRQLLAQHGLKDHFAGFAFSDEVGHSKPHPAMFELAAKQLGTRFEEMVHIGDRDHNDVKGPQALGMKAVLFTASRDRDKATTSADAVCAHHAELPAIIDRLAAAG